MFDAPELVILNVEILKLKYYSLMLLYFSSGSSKHIS